MWDDLKESSLRTLKTWLETKSKRSNPKKLKLQWAWYVPCITCFCCKFNSGFASTKLNCFFHTLFVGLETYLCAFFSFENKLPVGFGNISELSSETL